MVRHLFFIVSFCLATIFSSVHTAPLNSPSEGHLNSLHRREDKPLFVGQTFTTGDIQLKITTVQCQTFTTSPWRFPSATNDRVWLANQVTTSIFAWRQGESNPSGEEISGGWKWYGIATLVPFAGVPYGILYQMWADAIVFGA